MNYDISLRASEAHLIEVVAIENYSPDSTSLPSSSSTGNNETAEQDEYIEKRHTINIALIGNPNCGKTSLFNVASGAHEHVGNYSGVTVDAKKGRFEYHGYKFNIVDLPGTYSLDAYSPEELYVRRYLKDETPDVMVNVVVASNLERNLYLTSELIDMDRKMVIALNMYDELEASGDELDYQLLGKMIGVPVVPTVSRDGRGLDKLFDTIIDVYEDKHTAVRHIHVNLGQDIENGVTLLKDMLKGDNGIGRHFSPRYIAIKLLQGDREAERIVKESPNSEAILSARDNVVKNIESLHGEDLSSAIASEKYGFIAGALAETYSRNTRQSESSTHILDTFVTSRLFGFPIFLLVLFVTFWCTFELVPTQWNGLNALLISLPGLLANTCPTAFSKTLLPMA